MTAGVVWLAVLALAWLLGAPTSVLVGAGVTLVALDFLGTAAWRRYRASRAARPDQDLARKPPALAVG